MEERVFTRSELATFDGREGRPAYVAWQGRVYDVTDSPLWEMGEHFEEHYAGNDLTEDLEELAPHGTEVLEDLPQVGMLEE